MAWLTGAVLALFVAYAGGWYSGAIQGNFAVLLLAATLVTGVYWVAEKLYFLPRRRAAADRLETQRAERAAALTAQGIPAPDDEPLDKARARLIMQPWWLDWTAGLFPVILVVFVLRSFLFEPFKIPSGSMIPTLLVGDLILVNKYHYGLRLPVLNKKITEGTPVARGDVMVFRYPMNPNLDYIKRVVGVPGDTVSYLDKKLTVNGQPVPKTTAPDFLDEQSMRYEKQFHEKLGGVDYNILNDPSRPTMLPATYDFPQKDLCTYSAQGFVCKVPAGHYFMMGDNRDNSEDSRYWGFVPDENIVGRAFFIWMNFSEPGRIGSFR
ncbi:MAG: Signal peptidase I [Paracidovorax wautersii]|uniref:Signal peptidase I n=1 Tax=Paracidovorax wautersii TaxID=1177982 RepID=A0A7V8JPI5_9BURK|nr:MAG: Signal peptidase I [Paracidovorax wautersii]